MDFSRPDNARKINRLKVLSALRHEELSKAEISRRLGINKVSIGEIIDAMVREGLIEEAGKAAYSSGRPAMLLSIKPDSGRVLSIDMRRKSVSVSVSDPIGRILRFERFPRTESLIPDLERTIRKMRGTDDTRIYGIAIVGEDIDISSIIDAPKIVLSRIEAESASEMARMEKKENTLFVSWSDSMEAVFYHDGFIPLPQFPHIKAQREGDCSCGGRGCLEAAASGKVLLERSGAKGYRDLLSSFPDIIKGSLKPMAAALSMAIQSLSADNVIITGEMAAMPEGAFSYLQSLIASALPPSRSGVTIAKAQSGDKGAREGAAILALDEFFYHTRLLGKLAAIERIAYGSPNGI